MRRYNAVAPDWNLKLYIIAHLRILPSNAVAPDWNLKEFNQWNRKIYKANAVAPDWNLKSIMPSACKPYR